MKSPKIFEVLSLLLAFSVVDVVEFLVEDNTKYSVNALRFWDEIGG
ncbi:unnamed protein product [Brassica oleracea var. botrytis]|uniref:(rape) hypothetical protein n=1 Tax=Brassica napus TaxID=3708 RepID=A0A816LZA2_BRANA|nr:unnamed protein product [Brassica napus]